MTSRDEKAIFLAAVEKETEQEREAFLAEACGEDARLRADVEQLLCAHDQPDPLLDSVLEQVGVLHDHLQGSASGDTEKTPSHDSSRSTGEPDLGTRIGRYRLMELIGEGGFGLVYVAEQSEPVRRQVALKVVKPGVDTREVIARFEAERQALALMDHPNIARVLDAGATEQGRPYFLMELVRGDPITSFCEEQQLNTRARLELFLMVCSAVQHAHQKGIIHRDLKPSNVLVTLHDDTPVVKVIDFGIAKAIGQQLTEKTLYTRFAQMIGTPLYMSPEQAKMSGLDVDTRSDIYSLGVLLYELLTGTTPFDRKRLQTADFDELRKIIREEEPPRPSVRITTLEQASRTSAVQGSLEPRKLSALLRGDLDWIVMKAMEKNRSRRYDTAAALAADLRRFLNSEPVEARPPSPLYRFQKFARRNRITLTTASLVLATLLLGTIVSSWQAIRARSAQKEADVLRARAEDFAERLKEANVLLDSARAHADEGRWALAETQYSRAASLQPEHYLVWSGRGLLYLRLGLWELAAADYARAIDLGAPVNNPGWWGIPQLFLYTGDEQNYRKLCEQMLQHTKQSTDIMSNAFTVRSCLTSPKPVTNPSELAALAERWLATSQNLPGGPISRGLGPQDAPRWHPPDRGQPPPRPPRPEHLLHYLVGLAHYRAGEMETAIQHLTESMDIDPRWPASAIGVPVLAMAHQQLGQTNQARQTLTRADETIDNWLNQMVEASSGSTPVPWFDLLEYLCLNREAQILITGNAPPEDARMQTLQDRALAAIGH